VFFRVLYNRFSRARVLIVQYLCVYQQQKFLQQQNKPKEDFLRIFKNVVPLETVETSVIVVNDGSQTPNNFRKCNDLAKTKGQEPGTKP
jgi:hypothetical protein